MFYIAKCDILLLEVHQYAFSSRAPRRPTSTYRVAYSAPWVWKSESLTAKSYMPKLTQQLAADSLMAHISWYNQWYRPWPPQCTAYRRTDDSVMPIAAELLVLYRLSCYLLLIQTVVFQSPFPCIVEQSYNVVTFVCNISYVCNAGRQISRTRWQWSRALTSGYARRSPQATLSSAGSFKTMKWIMDTVNAFCQLQAWHCVGRHAWQWVLFNIMLVPTTSGGGVVMWL